jgi:replicative DNA helicase
MELERALLGTMLKSKIYLRQHVNKLKSEYFTTKERKFIRDNIARTMKSSKGLLTREVFDYELRSRIEEKEIPFYESEWTLIESQATTEEPEVLIDRLHMASVGRQLMDIAEDVVLTLEKGSIDDAIRKLRNSAAKIADRKDEAPYVEVTDYKSRLDLIRDKQQHPEKYLGIKTGFGFFDRCTGGLFPSEFTLISAITGMGKSTLMKQIGTGIITCNDRKNVLHVCNEEHLLQVQTKFDAQLTQIPYSDFKMATITDEAVEKWRKKMEIDMKRPGLGRLFIKEVPAFTDVSLIEETLSELEQQGIKIHVVVIDHLPHVKPIEQAWGEFDEQGKAAADCKELARSWQLSVLSATQAATIVADKQAKGRKAGDMDVFGSKKQLHVANTHMSVTKIGVDDTQTDREEWERDVFWCGNVSKNRDGAKFSFKMKHHVRFGFVEEVKDITAEAEKKMKEVLEKENTEEAEVSGVKEVTGGVVEKKIEEVCLVAEKIDEMTIGDGLVDTPTEQETVQETVTESVQEVVQEAEAPKAPMTMLEKLRAKKLLKQ